MRVGLIGPYPPPRGGVSVFLQRLEEALIDQGVEVTIFDNNPRGFGGRIRKKFCRAKWWYKLFTCAQMDILHINVNNWRNRILIILIAKIRNFKTVITFHSLRDELDEMSMLQSKAASFVINHADYIIAAGENEKNKLLKQFNCVVQITVLPAFISPKQVERDLPEHIMEFIRSHALIVSANGSNMDFYQETDIYGLDMLVELCAQLSLEMDVGFIYCLTHVTDKVYFEKIMDRISELRIDASFLIVLDSIEFWPILKRSCVFVRPTCTDSYGVSVAEAIIFGVPSIASDVCARPEGSILFQNRNSEDLYVKISEVIKNYDQVKACLQYLQIEDSTPSILKIYQELVEKNIS